jgi:hypothetical protein
MQKHLYAKQARKTTLPTLPYKKIDLGRLGQRVFKTIPIPTAARQTLIFVSLATLVYFIRARQYILQPQLYADDGGWLQVGYHNGIKSLFIPLNGFLHLPERLFGFFVTTLPLDYAPFLFNFCAGLVFVLMAYYLFSNRTRLFNNTYERIFMLFCLSLMANVEEFFFNFSNSVFLLGIVSLLIMVADKPRSSVVAFLEKIIFILSCLTLPFTWFYLPVAVFQRAKYKQKNNFFLITAIVTSIIQLFVYLTSHVERSAVTVQSLSSKYTFLELYNQIITPAFRFARIDTPLQLFNDRNWYIILSVLFATFVCILAALWVIKKSNKTVGYLLFFLGAMTFASIASPTIVSTNSIEAIKYMAITLGGDRYFIFGIIGLSIIAGKLSYNFLTPGSRYPAFIVFAVFSIITSLQFGSFFVNKHFTDLRKQYHESIHSLKTQPKGSSVFFPINPHDPHAPPNLRWVIQLKVK